MGTRCSCAAGNTARTPRAIASAAALAVRLPLNESGAITSRMARFYSGPVGTGGRTSRCLRPRRDLDSHRGSLVGFPTLSGDVVPRFRWSTRLLVLAILVGALI